LKVGTGLTKPFSVNLPHFLELDQPLDHARHTRGDEKLVASTGRQIYGR